MMTVLLVDYELGRSSYRLVIKDDNKKKLYVWKRVNNLFNKKLSKKLVNKLILEDSKFDLNYMSDGYLSGIILWKYEMR